VVWHYAMNLMRTGVTWLGEVMLGKVGFGSVWYYAKI
jgi:hypothetical protein